MADVLAVVVVMMLLLGLLLPSRPRSSKPNEIDLTRTIGRRKR